MLLSLVSFLQRGPVGQSLEEFSQMMALGEGLSGCSMSNPFLGIIVCTGFSETSFLIGRFINRI